jgi:hypothetical protein
MQIPHARSVCLLAVLTATSAFHALAGNNTYYQWRDEHGTVHHSDKAPPKGVDYEVVSTDSGLKRVVEAEEGVVPLETEPTVGNEFKQIKKKPDTSTEPNPILCERAQKDLETLTSSDEVAVRNEQGEVRYLDDEEIEVERFRAQKTIERNCK